jgi:dTDP-glucose 4,6-dehydratase
MMEENGMQQGSFLVTGGAGFIGSSFVDLLLKGGHKAVVLDAMTYAGHSENLVAALPKIKFVKGDILDTALVVKVLTEQQITHVVNFAAESHVDRSITDAGAFVKTNVLGVYSLLQASLGYWSDLHGEAKNRFRFLHVSTDEVFGALGEEGKFSETTGYAPNSPYSASKAGGDHLVRAWYHTYKLPTLITNCSNNYGLRQFPEKLIPHMINCALQEKPLPVYGNGRNIRDWVHVEDHCAGVLLALEKGQLGEAYCFGGNSERRNIDVVMAICKLLDSKKPRANGKSYQELITFVEDRKGHDWRYAIDDSRAQAELGFVRKYKAFEDGLSATVDWYLANGPWMRAVLAHLD